MLIIFILLLLKIKDKPYLLDKFNEYDAKCSLILYLTAMIALFSYLSENVIIQTISLLAIFGLNIIFPIRVILNISVFKIKKILKWQIFSKVQKKMEIFLTSSNF